MLEICESCGYRGSQVIYEPTTQDELCLRCYGDQIFEWAFLHNWIKLKSQHSPQTA